MKIITGKSGAETIVEPAMPPNTCIVLGEKEVVYFRDGKTEIVSRKTFDDLMFQAERFAIKMGPIAHLDARELENRVRRVLDTELDGI